MKRKEKEIEWVKECRGCGRIMMVGEIGYEEGVCSECRYMEEDVREWVGLEIEARESLEEGIFGIMR